MKNSTEIESFICPCCGNSRQTTIEICPTCLAQPIGSPMAQPENKLPGLGPALIALGMASIVLLAYIATWLLGNDMKVARVLIVSLFGEGTKFTKSLLQLDPSLLQYRIFTFDAYQLACYMSLILIPLSLVGIWLGRRALKLIKVNPLQFGGRGMAQAALTTSVIWCVLFSAAGISSIPRALQRGHAKHLAAVRAQFYQLHNESLNRYYAEFGTYPAELSDLRDFIPEAIQTTDYWGTSISYSPTSLLASKDSRPGFNNYQMVSAGPDGVMDTADDIRMIDGVIVTTTDEGDWFSSFFKPKSNSNDR